MSETIVLVGGPMAGQVSLIAEITGSCVDFPIYHSSTGNQGSLVYSVIVYEFLGESVFSIDDLGRLQYQYQGIRWSPAPQS